MSYSVSCVKLLYSLSCMSYSLTCTSHSLKCMSHSVSCCVGYQPELYVLQSELCKLHPELHEL